MRHPLVPAAVVVLLLAAYGVAGVALAGGAADRAVTVEGTVTGTDGTAAGDAVVLVGDYAMLAKLPPSELRAAAAANRSGLTVVEVASDGTFAANVSAARADGAVALSDDGVSETVRLGNRDATLSLRLHERRPQTVHAAAAPAGPGEETRVHVDLHNTGDHAVGNLTVTLTALPDGWTVVGSDTDGTYDADERTLAWDSVGAGESVDATLTVAVPGDAAVGTYALSLRAASDATPVSVENATVEVREATENPTATYAGTVAERTAQDTSTTATASQTGATTSPPTGPSTPGFGVAAALAALAAAALALRADRR